MGVVVVLCRDILRPDALSVRLFQCRTKWNYDCKQRTGGNDDRSACEPAESDAVRNEYRRGKCFKSWTASDESGSTNETEMPCRGAP